MERARYSLRYAAGAYWLLDIQQADPEDYRPPLQLNEMGADIVKMLNAGWDREQIVQSLCAEYGVEQEMVEKDVASFLQTMKENQIDLTGKKGAVLV